MKMTRYWILLVTFIINSTPYQCTENWPSSDIRDPRIQRVLEGRDVVLRCAGRMENTKARWEYQPCGGVHSNMLCSDAMNQVRRDGIGKGWVALEGADSPLKLRSVTPNHSGLYRCRQSASQLIDLKSTTRLEVLPHQADEDTDMPQFVDGLPENITVHKDTQMFFISKPRIDLLVVVSIWKAMTEFNEIISSVNLLLLSETVFQCKVYSRTPPRILWVALKAGAGTGDLQYLENWYDPLQSAGEVALEGNVHLSKMVLPRARAQDAGTYFCVAINTKGFTYKSAYLEVLGDNDNEDWQNGKYDTRYLYLLYLLPLGLAFVPLMLWVWYLCRVRRRKKKEGDTTDIGSRVLMCDVCHNQRNQFEEAAEAESIGNLSKYTYKNGLYIEINQTR